MEAGVITFAVPVLFGFLAQALLPLQSIAAHAPDTLKIYLADGKSVGSLIAAIAAIVVWPLVWLRQHRKVYGYHPKGTYQPGKINIWIAELEGDSEKHEARRRMAGSLADLFGNSVAVLLADTAPHLVDTGLAGQEADAGNQLAQDYLEANQGELILWGQYLHDPAPIIELRLVSVAQDGKQATLFEYDSTTYKPSEKRVRPYFTAALAGLVAAMAQRGEEDDGRYVADVLSPLAEKIRFLADNLPAGIGPGERARIFHGLGILYFVIGKQEDSMLKLELSARMLLRARRCWRQVPASTREAGKTSHALGLTYCQLGWRSIEVRFLWLCLKTLGAALNVFTPELDFRLWAECKANEAWAHYFLGFRSGLIEQLEQGVVDADGVLRRSEVSDFPRSRAAALNALAALYTSLGTFEQRTARCQLAIEAFRELTTIWTKDTTPLLWARTQINIAVTSVTLWDLESRREILADAWTACEEALSVFSPICEPGACGETRALMGDILRRKREWKGAAEMYLKALTTLSRQTNEFAYMRCKESLRAADEELRREGYAVRV